MNDYLIDLIEQNQRISNGQNRPTGGNGQGCCGSSCWRQRGDQHSAAGNEESAVGALPQPLPSCLTSGNSPRLLGLCGLIPKMKQLGWGFSPSSWALTLQNSPWLKGINASFPEGSQSRPIRKQPAARNTWCPGPTLTFR